MTGGLRSQETHEFGAPARPWLSVIMPTFNGARFIQRSLESVARAEEEGLECIVIDDGSSDGTRQMVSSYDGILRLRVEDGPRRGNWVASSNAGVQAATGEYVTFLHQDDEWLPGRLDMVKELVRQSADAVLYVHAARFLSGAGRDLGAWTLPMADPRGVTDGPEFVERLLIQNFLCIGAPVFRRRQFLAAGGLNEDLWYTADWDLWLRLAATGMVAHDSRCLVGFRIHTESQTHTRSVEPLMFRRQMEQVFEAHLSDWAGGAGRLARVVERAGRASIELNVALAALSHKSVPPFRPLIGAMVALGPESARRLARDSCLKQRVGARIRAAREDGRGPHLLTRSWG